jgi:hypothetical protein
MPFPQQNLQLRDNPPRNQLNLRSIPQLLSLFTATAIRISMRWEPRLAQAVESLNLSRLLNLFLIQN